MVYSTKRFVLSFALCYFVLMIFFSVLLALRLPRLGKRELILVILVRFFRFALVWFVCFSSPWCLGRAAACDCDTPLTFFLPFLYILTMICQAVDPCWSVELGIQIPFHTTFSPGYLLNPWLVFLSCRSQCLVLCDTIKFTLKRWHINAFTLDWKNSYRAIC